MTAADLVNMIRADGAQLTLTPSGRVRLTGADVDRWLPVLAQYEQELTEALASLSETDLKPAAGAFPRQLCKEKSCSLSKV